MKKFDDSRKAAAQCLAALPNYAPALNNLALLQITLGQLTDADGNLRASMEADAGLTCTQSNAASLQVRALALCLRALLACFACVLCLRALFARFVCALCLRALLACFACVLCLRALFACFGSVGGLARATLTDNALRRCKCLTACVLSPRHSHAESAAARVAAHSKSGQRCSKYQMNFFSYHSLFGTGFIGSLPLVRACGVGPWQTVAST
jgi:hypothetical protein